MKNGAEKRKRSILCRIGAAALCVLLGGFILLVDGKEYDYSMAGRLNRLEQTLMRR